VYVEGTPDVRGYVRQDGQQGVSLELNVRELQLLGSRGDAEGGGYTASTSSASQPDSPATASPHTSSPVSEPEEDDLPF
ncbi:MAG: single-stranded DNA-binding protein, partial [bacterium]